MQTSLRSQAISGTFWTTLSAVVKAVIQILRISILTRFLDKSDFGLVAIVVMVMGFTQIFVDLGVSASLFSRAEISKREYSSLYWVGLMLSLVFYCLILLAAPLLGLFYKLPALKELLPIMGLDLIFFSGGRQFRIFKEKALKFKSLAFIDIASLVISLIVAIVLAKGGWGIYSLVYSALSASFISSLFLIIFGYNKHPLILHVNIREGKEFYRIGVYQTGTQIMDYMSSQLDILIIGKVMPVGDLGVYSLVKQLVLRVYGSINPIVTNVSIPLLAKLDGQTDLLKNRYLQMIHFVAFVNFGIYGCMAVLANEVLGILYGPSYQSASLLLQVLCIWGCFSAVGSAVSTIVIIKGRTDLGFSRTMLRLVINPICVVLGSLGGLIGVVVGQVCYSMIFFIVNWKLLIDRIIKSIPFRVYADTIVSFLIVDLIVVSILLALRGFIDVRMSTVWANLTIWGGLFFILYMLFTKNTLLSFIKILRSRG